MFGELVGYLLTRQSPNGGSAALFESVAAPGGAPKWLHHHGSAHWHSKHGEQAGHGGAGADAGGSGGAAAVAAAGDGGGGHHASAPHSHHRWRFDPSTHGTAKAAGEGQPGPPAEQRATGGGGVPWLPPPMVPDNDEETHGESCFFGADLKSAVTRMEARARARQNTHHDRLIRRYCSSRTIDALSLRSSTILCSFVSCHLSPLGMGAVRRRREARPRRAEEGRRSGDPRGEGAQAARSRHAQVRCVAVEGPCLRRHRRTHPSACAAAVATAAVSTVHFTGPPSLVGSPLAGRGGRRWAAR